MRSSRLDLAVVALVAFSVRLFVAWEIPLGARPGTDPNRAPDESGHFDVVEKLARGHLPRWPRDGNIYAAYLPSNYAAQAAALWTLSPIASEFEPFARIPPRSTLFHGYDLARVGSVLLGTAAALLLMAAAFTVTSSRGVGIAVGLAAALYPQLVFVTSYVNGDALTVAAGSALLFALARWIRAGESGVHLLGVGVASGLVLLGKPNGYALLPPTAVWIAWAGWRGGREVRRATFRAVAVAALVASPFLLLNAVRNHGDALGTGTFQHYVKVLHPELKDGRDLEHPLGDFVELFSKSSFGLFGNMDLSMEPAWYRTALALLVVGALLTARSLRSASPVAWRSLAWGAASLAINLALVVRMSWFVDFQPQGRYALLPIVLLTLAFLAGPAAGAASKGARRWAWPIVGVTFLGAAAAEMLRLLWVFPLGR